MSIPNFVGLAWLAGLFLLGCGEPIVVAAGPEDASTPDSQHVVDAAVTDSRDAAVEDKWLPPFSIPDAPEKGSLRPCGTTAEPMPVGFLQDGRALIAQQIGSSKTLVRAWDPATNALEDIFTTESGWVTRGAPITMSQDGDRVIVRGGARGFEWFRIFDWGRRRFVTDSPVQVAIESASGDGQFVIGSDLVRWNAVGAEPFNFYALLPADLHVLPDPGLIALSPSGDAVAVAPFNRGANLVVPAVVYQDGRVVILPHGPDSDLIQATCAGECGFRWSRDGRRLLLFSPLLLLRVWDVERNSLLVAEEPGVRFANFLPSGTRLITVAVDGAVVERDVAGGSIFTWGMALNHRTGFFPALDDIGNRLLFRGSRPGDQGSGLALATRDAGGAYWRSTFRAWDNSALALADNSLFALLKAWDQHVEPSQITVGRYAVGGGPLTHIFDPGPTNERQTEWQGQIVVSPDEQRVAAVLPDTVRVLDAATLAPLATIPSGAGMVAWSPNGAYLASTPDLHYRDHARTPFVPRAEVTLWDALSGRAAARFPVPVVPSKVAFDDQGNKLVGWGYSSVVPVPRGDVFVEYKTSGDRVSFDVDLATDRSVLSPMLPFVGATRELVATSTSILRISTGEVVSSLAVPPIQSAVFSGDASILLGLNGNLHSLASLRLFGVKDGHLIASTPGEVYFPGRTALALSRDGRRVAGSTSDNNSSVVVYCLDEPR
jgi:WD40 repeat protein